MNIKNLTDSQLMQTTDGLVKEERKALTNLLLHFREIERRRLYCDYKYASLHKMLVGHYGYSDDEAYRRTSAMKLLKDLPEVEEKINSGELNLSHWGLAQSFFRQESKILQAQISKETKLEILSQISEQPIKEAKRIVLSQSSAPEELRPDKVTVVTESKNEYRFTADKSLEDKISEVKGLLAHKYPSLSMAELLGVLCELGIETLKNQKTATARKPRDTKVAPTTAASDKSFSQIQREVWQESDFHCSNCESNYALETDHRRSKAKGGTNAKENLRVLCRSCNQRAAIRQLGQNKMDPYLN
jgi:5-methylcytosine-specific restriction endonuclease McrA